MRVAACLLIGSLAVAVLVPHGLRRLTRSGRAPRLGVAAWLAAIGGVLGAWLAVPVFLVQDVATPAGYAGRLARACLAMLRAVLGTGVGGAVEVFLAAGALFLAVRLYWRLVCVAEAGRRHGRRHAEAARIVGRRVPGVEAMVVDSAEMAAYCLAGRPGTVVVTSGAVEALTQDELAAVLAHEHAHLTGRHHLLRILTRGLAQVCPRVWLFTAAAAEIDRLLEMCADDAAARRHGPLSVATALLTLSGAATGPAGALAAGGPGALARAERLLAPPAVGSLALARAMLTAATVVLLVGPVVTVALAAVGVNLCALPAAA